MVLVSGFLIRPDMEKLIVMQIGNNGSEDRGNSLSEETQDEEIL